MAITFEKLQALLKQLNFHFLIEPERTALRAQAAGLFGRYEFAIRLEFDGQFIQFRTIGFLSCPANHPHLPVVLRALGDINFKRRMLKCGWDPADGEIMAYVDLILMDNDLTQEQLSRTMGIYFPAVDQAYERLRIAIAAGTDPGELTQEELMKRAAAASAAKPEGPAPGAAPAAPKPAEPPSGLKGLLDRLGRKPGKDDPDARPTEPPIAEI